MDINKIVVNEQRLLSLGQNHGEIAHGTFSYADPDKPGKIKEGISYWTKDPFFAFIQSAKSPINGYEQKKRYWLFSFSIYLVLTLSIFLYYCYFE